MTSHSLLDKKIDYLIESGMWKLSDGEKHDNIDLIRALIIKDDYLKWKNDFKYDIMNNTSFKNDELDNEKVALWIRNGGSEETK